jgi:tryptophan synthase alpha chain
LNREDKTSTEPPSRIAETFAALKSAGRMAFMPFVTGGDPDMKTTCALLGELGNRGVDLIEVGFPYSDPIADGPVIQASYTRALDNGLQMSEIFAGISSLPTENLPPLVAMVSYAIIFKIGDESFVRQARQAGFSGMIVPDLPGDEAAAFFKLVRSHGLDLVQLVAPTTPPERVERILQSASGFVYCIAVAGTTGERAELPESLRSHLRNLRSLTDLPLAVGFGISKPEQVDTLRGVADGVIVGSAIVRRLEGLSEERSDCGAILKTTGEFAAQMAAATHA